MDIFSTKEFLPGDVPHAPLLFPFWGFLPLFGDASLDRHRFEKYMAQGSDYFRFTELADAQAAVLPFEWDQIVCYEQYHKMNGLNIETDGLKRAVEKAQEFVAVAGEKGKSTVVFLSQDGIEKVPLDNSIVFRTSLMRSSRLPNEYALPYWMPDEVEASFENKLPIRQKHTRPVIGFCGQNPVKLNMRTKVNHALNTVRGLRGVAYRLGVRPAANFAFYIRALALQAVERNQAVDNNFLIRDQWFDGAFMKGASRAQFSRARREYVENMFASDYILCPRGNGNFSIRFYETLCSGRIPVFINTDCVLPFEDWIDWKQYCVWVEEDEVPLIAKKVLAFHDGLSDREFRDRQLACRELWEKFLSPHGFFRNLCRYFD